MEEINNNEIILRYLRNIKSILEANYEENKDPSNYHSLRFVQKEHSRYIQIINNS